MSGHRYFSLPSSHHIRLFQLEPVEKTSRISITLSIWELTEALEYAAISYVWGNSEAAIPIHIEGNVVVVRENCYCELSQLQHQCLSEFYWMGTLCINQSSIEEKNAQVAIMAEIYSRPQCVVASL